MNSKRLTTFRDNINIDQESVLTLRSRIEKLLSGWSNLEVKADGCIFIKSLNKYYSPWREIPVDINNDEGLTLETFYSISCCASFLGCSRMLVMNKLKDEKPAVIDNKVFHIIKHKVEE